MLNKNVEHVTKDGKTIPLRDITDSNLVNIIKYIEKRSREGFYVSMISCWNPADHDSMDYQEDYVKGGEALSILNHDTYVNELKRREAKKALRSKSCSGYYYK